MGLVRLRSKELERVDWAGWNGALARVQLVGPPSIVEAALKPDAAFWSIGTGIRENVDEAGWCQLRDEVELRRLEFVNAARRQLSPSAASLYRLVGKPGRQTDPTSSVHKGLSSASQRPSSRLDSIKFRRVFRDSGRPGVCTCRRFRRRHLPAEDDAGLDGSGICDLQSRVRRSQRAVPAS